jgi:hypothetical protein
MLETVFQHVVQALPQSLLLELGLQEVYPARKVLVLLDILDVFLEACKLSVVVLALRIISLGLGIKLMKVVLDKAKLRVVLRNEFIELKLMVSFDVHQRPDLGLCALNKFTEALDFCPICGSDRLVLAVEVGIDVSFEFVEFVKLDVVLALVVFDLLHEVRLDFKFLGPHLRLEDGDLFGLLGHLLLQVGAESSHGDLDFFDLCAPIDDLGECVSHLPLSGDLVISDLMVATDHLLGPLNDFILEDVKALLKRVQAHSDFRFLLSELRVLTNLRLDLAFNVTLDLAEIILGDIEL